MKHSRRHGKIGSMFSSEACFQLQSFVVSLSRRQKIGYYRILYLIRYSLYPAQQSNLKSWSNARKKQRVTTRQKIRLRDQWGKRSVIKRHHTKVYHLPMTQRVPLENPTDGK